MTREELIARIKQHEAQCNQTPGAFFHVEEVMELAEGALAVRDTDGEYTIYYDKTLHMIRNDVPFEDDSQMIADFPSHTGFVVNVMAGNWSEIVETAKLSLTKLSGDDIDWREAPVKLEC